MSNDPDKPPPRPFSLGDLLRVAATTLIAGGALGYLIADYDDDTMHGLARIASSVGLVTVVLLIFELRRRCQVEQVRETLEEVRRLLDERLERQRRWDAYTDALSDLAGIDGESSTDSGRMPPRP